MRIILNLIWLIFGGLWLCLGYKLIPISLMPLGREIVPTDEPFAHR